jgi:hypothetical protein
MFKIHIRNLFSVLALITLLSTLGSPILAQDDELVNYENDVFTLKVPGWLERQEESAERTVFAAEASRIEVYSVPLSPEARALLQEFGNDLENKFLLVMQMAFAGSDYEINACSSLVKLPCVEFIDQPTLRRANIYDAQNGGLYALTFSAPTANDMTRLRVDEVMASFAFAQQMTSSAGSTAAFNVVTTSNANLRTCAAATCDLAGQVSTGQVLSVIGEDGDWYQVTWENGTAYIASWLTARGPDVYVDLTEGYEDPKTGCQALLRLGRGDGNLDIAISGEKRDDVWVDVYRPNENTPVEVFAQYDKTFIDSDEPYIHQAYYWGTWWPTGTYQLELTLGDTSSMIAFDIPETGGHTLYVQCD